MIVAYLLTYGQLPSPPSPAATSFPVASPPHSLPRINLFSQPTMHILLTTPGNSIRKLLSVVQSLLHRPATARRRYILDRILVHPAAVHNPVHSPG
jgi:hypothetical protein